MEGFKQGAQTHPGLSEAGEAMGFKRGGQVKQNPESPQFRQTTKQMESMDDGVQPAREGRNEQEKEAGGTKRMTPGYKEGGKAKKMHYKDGGYVKCKHGGKMAYKKGGEYYRMGEGGYMYRMGDPGGGKEAMRKRGKGVVKKAHGGLAGQNASNQRRNTVDSMPNRSEGEGVKPSGRGAKNVGRGGKTGKHRTGRLKD